MVEGSLGKSIAELRKMFEKNLKAAEDIGFDKPKPKPTPLVHPIGASWIKNDSPKKVNFFPTLKSDRTEPEKIPPQKLVTPVIQKEAQTKPEPPKKLVSLFEKQTDLIPPAELT